jgi:hypothetical protein
MRIKDDTTDFYRNNQMLPDPAISIESIEPLQWQGPGNVMVDMTPTFTLASDQSGIRIPLREIDRVHTEEFDTWTTILATGLALAATAGLLYLGLPYGLSIGGR